MAARESSAYALGFDEVSSGHPVFLSRVDGHLAVANTRALQLASVSLASRDPKGGKIDRNETGEPTGILGTQRRTLSPL